MQCCLEGVGSGHVLHLDPGVELADGEQDEEEDIFGRRLVPGGGDCVRRVEASTADQHRLNWEAGLTTPIWRCYDVHH